MEPVISPLDASDPLAAARLAGLQERIGRVPNMLATMARSPAVLDGYLSLNACLARSRLSPRQREQIALAVAGLNGCDYCMSAHTAYGLAAGLTASEAAESCRGRSSDAETQALLDLASEIVANRGRVSVDTLQSLRSQGFIDEVFVETLGLVALNLFSNYFNNMARPRIDFPGTAEVLVGKGGNGAGKVPREI